MKTLRVLALFALVSFAFAGLSRAADDAGSSDKAQCCAKAAADGKECGHGCCVAAAKDGKNCEKCGGKNEKKA